MPNFKFVAHALDKAPAMVALVGEDGWSKEATELDKAHGGVLKKAAKAQKFEGKFKQTLAVVPAGEAELLVLIGVGKAKDLDATKAARLGGVMVPVLNGTKVKEAAVVLSSLKGLKMDEEEIVANMAMGARMKSFRFDKYRTTEKEEKKPTLKTVSFSLDRHTAARAAFKELDAIVDGIELTREVVSEPANVIHPESLAEKCKDLQKDGVKVEVLGEKQMKKLGMGALLGVGQGSAFESQLVVMTYNGAKDKKAKPLAFVGKGVTFDTGGISIKPSGGMEEMKWDMGGSGTVIGLMRALARRKAKVNVVGVVGLVENMPSSTAQRPGDVVTSMSGQTIEVINTDAEGRLVLADALYYTNDRFKPECIVDLATLTGAIIVSLGFSRAGLFSNDDKLADTLHKLGEETGERLWRLPVGEEYADHIDSPIADMQNVGKSRQAGSVSAAEFLSRFIGDTPWAHLDIAGTAWANESSDLVDKGASGFGVRLLDRFAATYEK